MKPNYYLLSRQDRKPNKNQYLLNYKKNITSQNGEDGIIEQIFKIIKPQNKWCVELGAWDGKHFSNTNKLITNNNWHGLLIEGNKEKYNEILTSHKKNKVIAINKYIDLQENKLDIILSKTLTPSYFDFLSIDVDGIDWHIWNSLETYKPNVVCIEYNGMIPDNIEFIQLPNLKIRQGSSILSMVTLAKNKEYELVCINADNAFFVKKEYFSLFNIENNSISSLKNFNEMFQTFQLYDGTIMSYGCQHLLYYTIPINFNKKFQLLPKWIRKAGMPWGDCKGVKKLFVTIFLKIYSFINRDRSILSKMQNINKHWIKS